ATTDTKKLSFAVFAVLGILLLLGSGLIFFFAQKPAHIVFSGASVAVCSIGALALYGRMINSGIIDLVPMAKNETAPQ
ncbi:MAG: hypothetical protein ABIV39_01950, partial [Verrucomicrobiota bacterium]